MRIQKNIVPIIKSLIFVIVFFVILYFFLPFITSDSFKQFAESHIYLGALFVILYVIMGHIVAPIAGFPAASVSLAVYGIYKTYFFIYLAGTISSAINFYISRKYGRRIVKKFVGNKGMQNLDEFVQIGGTKMLIIARLFGITFFDVVSYAFGLTKISFKKYYFITIICSAISGTITLLLFRNINFKSITGVILWIGTIGIVGLLFSLYIHRVYKKYKRNKKN